MTDIRWKNLANVGWKISANVSEKQLMLISAITTLVTHSYECWTRKSREQKRELEWTSPKKKIFKFHIFWENLKYHCFSQSKWFIKIPKIKSPFKYFIQTSYFIMNHFKFLEKMNSSTKLLHPNTLLEKLLVEFSY